MKESLDNYAGYFIQQLEMAKQAEKLNKNKPVNRPKRDRNMLMLSFLSIFERENKGDQMEVKTTYITGNRHTSKKLFDDLELITLNKMMVPKVHFNSYLLCRTITKPKTIIGTMVLIEDINGDVENLSLYNFHRLHEKSDAILPIGTIIIIKEPYMKYGSIGESVSIRVDSPSDVIILDETSEFLRFTGWMKPLKDSFETTKSKANEYYKSKDYTNSIKYYNRALRIQINELIYLNRSASYLQLHRYCKAYNDAKKAYDMGANKEKALYRMGKASYGMRDWKKAIDHFKTLLDLFPNSNDAVIELKKSKQRLEESLTGNYDLITLYDQSYNKKIIYMDVADYVGPVEIADVKGKGKGLIVRNDIKKGTLLLASKAFSFTNAIDENNNKTAIMSLNMITNRLETSSQALNLIETVQTLKSNPNRSHEFYSLYAGELDRTEVIGDGVIDIARIENICSFNSFQADPFVTTTIVNEKESNETTGLWIMPSYINHSCLGNSYRTFYGDFMMIFAIDDIKKSDEITISYLDHFKSHKERLDLMQKYKFVCKCELCLLDASDDLYNVRNELFKNEYYSIKSLMDSNPKNALDRSIKLVDKLRKSYEKRNKFQLSLFMPLVLLANLYKRFGEFEKAVVCYREMEDVCGKLLYQTIPQSLLAVAECYRLCNKIDYAFKYLNKAIEMNKIRMGGDKAVFKFLYSDLLKQSDLSSLL